MNGNIGRFVEEMAAAGKQSGVDKLNFHIESIRKQGLEVSEGQVADTVLSDETLVSIEGSVDGRMGAAFTETFDPAAIPQLVDILRQTAKANGIPFTARQLAGGNSEAHGAQLPDLSKEAGGLLEAEQEMYAAHTAVNHVTLGLTAVRRQVTLAVESGASATDSMASVSYSARVMAKADGKVQTADGGGSATGIPDYKAEGKRVALESGTMLGAKPCPAGSYAAVIRGDVFAELLDAYLPVFFADNVQRGLSKLGGKDGSRIASELLTLSENPLGLVRRTFDDEGAPTWEKHLIQNGCLDTLLYNARTAAAAGIGTTGNGYRASYRSDIATAATNLLLPGGDKDLAGLLRSMGRGILITNCDGIFAGANTVSGDFSLISKGWHIENGELQYPVNQITIGGNFYTLLRQIAGVGNDHHANLFSPVTSISTPSVLVEKLAVSS